MSVARIFVMTNEDSPTSNLWAVRSRWIALSGEKEVLYFYMISRRLYSLQVKLRHYFLLERLSRPDRTILDLRLTDALLMRVLALQSWAPFGAWTLPGFDVISLIFRGLKRPWY